VPDDKDTGRRAAWLAEDTARVLARSKDLQEETLQAAEEVAATEDDVADTLDHLAEGRPQDAARLQAKSASARDQAARERQWARDHQGTG
jgi:ABC-type transporter Mla subunit MlaD